MADAANATDEDVEEGGKKKLPLLMIVAPAAVVLLLVLGAGAYFLFFSAEPEPELDANGEEVVEAPETFFYALPDLTVNLTTADGRPAYLKMKISLEVLDRSVFDEIEPNIPKIMDTFQVYMRELRSTDLEGSGGLYRMKEELLRRINIAIFPAKVRAVLFQEILVQ